MKSKELKEVLELHKKWLADDGGKRADLRYANLERANLTGANLRDVDLTNAILTSADLRYVNLEGAYLINADLRGANLRNAILTDANLIGANLTGVDLEGANLEGANLRYANLERANLTGADLEGANLKYKLLRIDGSVNYFQGYNGEVRIGCEFHSLEFWFKNYKEIGKENKYTDKQIVEYLGYLKLYETFNGVEE
ncbi:MAG: pentapeptide repeat-containing protein [Promethearchaeota archaeon]